MAKRAKQILPTDGLVRLLREYGDAVLETAEEQAMDAVLNSLEAKAVELTPNLTGELEGSTSTRVEMRGTKIVGTLSFGAPHAAAAHENPPAFRGEKTQRKPGNEYGVAGPKYLERPLRGFTKLMGRDLAGVIREALQGGGIPNFLSRRSHGK